jgi:hypothetical protein
VRQLPAIFIAVVVSGCWKETKYKCVACIPGQPALCAESDDDAFFPENAALQAKTLVCMKLVGLPDLTVAEIDKHPEVDYRKFSSCTDKKDAEFAMTCSSKTRWRHQPFLEWR